MIPPSFGSESVVNCTDLFSDDKPYISEIDPICRVVLPFFRYYWTQIVILEEGIVREIRKHCILILNLYFENIS